MNGCSGAEGSWRKGGRSAGVREMEEQGGEESNGLYGSINKVGGEKDRDTYIERERECVCV